MILPNNDLSIIDVRNAIGYPSVDLGTLCSCGSPYINKWSKHKPIDRDFTDDSGYQMLDPYEWWKGKNFDCGLTYDTSGSLSGLLSILDNGQEQFRYQPPLGGEHSPYRLGDYRGYCTNATPPLWGGDFRGRTIDLSSTNTNNYFKPSFRGTNEYMLSSEDIFTKIGDLKGQDVYYGLAWRLNNTSTTYWTTSTEPLSNIAQVNVNISNIDFNDKFGEYMLFQFISSKQMPVVSTGDAVGGTFAPIPMQNGVPYVQHINVVKKQSFLYLENCKILRVGHGQDDVFTCEVYVRNASSRIVKYDQNVIYLKYRTDPIGTYRHTIHFEDFTVLANDEVRIPVKFSTYSIMPNADNNDNYALAEFWSRGVQQGGARVDIVEYNSLADMNADLQVIDEGFHELAGN